MYQLIESDQQLSQLAPRLLERCEAAGRVAVDTEFLREKTYFAKLCLIQLGVDDQQYCIDVLAIEDLQPIKTLFADASITKLFHAARQDMEILWQAFGLLPTPVFDTQLAAAFCGLDLQLGHTALVETKLNIQLAKSQARTDWSRRPLSKQQLHYAAEDVEHLANLQDLLLNELRTANKEDWFNEEVEQLYEVEKYAADPQSAYQRLAGGNFNLRGQYLLRALAEWREQKAVDSDIPRSWVIRDDRLYELVNRDPESIEDVIKLGVFGRKSAERRAAEVINIVNQLEVGSDPLWKKVEPLDKQQKSVVSAMMKQLKSLAESEQIAQGLLATRKDVESLYRHRDSKKLLSGWRKSLVGEPLLEVAERLG